MSNDTTPTSPESLPTSLAEGIPKQDESTLEDLQEYAEAVIQYHEQAVDPADLPESANSVAAGDNPDTVVFETVRSGDDSCQYSDPDGGRHGPCLYRYQSDRESLDSGSLGKPEDHPEIETT